MSLQVLVAEDDDDVRRAIVRSLKSSGLKLERVFEARNGKEGLRMLEEQNIDFALLDLNMPEMNGEELLRRIRKNPDLHKLPCIFISGEGDPERIRTLNKKVEGFIHKPVDMAHLATMIMDMMS